MIETGVVTDIKGNKLILNIRRSSACGSCNACKAIDTRHMSIALDNNTVARIGDTVKIEIDDSAIVKGALWLYGLPLAGLLLGVMCGHIITKRFILPMPEVISAISGIAAMSFMAIVTARSRLNKRYVQNLKVLEVRGGAL